MKKFAKMFLLLAMICLVACIFVACDEDTVTNHVHEYGDWEITTQATCIKEGLKKRTCSSCGNVQEVVIPKAEHTPVPDAAIAAGCTTTGLTEGSHCSVCNKELVKQQLIPALGHKYENGVCSRCGVEEDTGDYGLLFALKQDNTYEVTGYKEISETLTIPATYRGKPVTSIGEEAFVSNGTFEDRYVLRVVIISINITIIKRSAFRNCPYLKEVIVQGDALTTIEQNAFDGCNNLTSINLPDSLESIGKDAFCACSLTSITIPSSVTSIANNAFGSCLKLVHIINKSQLVLDIDDLIFSEDSGIKDFIHININIYYEIVTDASQFVNTLTTDENGVTTYKVGDDDYLIDYSGDESEVDLSGYEFNKVAPIAIAYNYIIIEIVLPDTVTDIDAMAFYAISVVKVTFGEGLTTLDEFAFSECFKLIEIYNRSDLPIISGDYTYGELGNVNYIYTEEGQGKVSDNNGYYLLTDYGDVQLVGYGGNDKNAVVPAGVTRIEEYAFITSEVESVVIPDSVVTISSYAFSICYNLTTITIGIGVTNIYDNAFNYCSNLTDIYYAGTREQWSGVISAYTNWYIDIAIIVTIHCVDGDIPPHVHNYVKDNVNSIEPTCTVGGYYHYVCSCGDYKNTYPEALGHDLIHHDAHAATCTEAGHEAYDTCSRCDYNTYSEINALGHDLIHHDAKAATCTEAGHDAYDTCSRCDYSTYSAIPALGHDYGDWTDGVPATCTESGTKGYYYCSVCHKYLDYNENVIGNSDNDIVIPALGHDLVHHNAQAATCTEAGHEAYDTCTRCDYNTYSEISATGHTEVIDQAVAATCTATGLTQGSHCSVCGVIISEREAVPALGHDMQSHAAVDPTCTESGNNAYYQCDRCHGYFEDEDGNVSTTPSAVIRPALGHNYENGFCTRCGAEEEGGDPQMETDENGLSYILQNDNTYMLAGVDEMATAITIPDTFNGLPVTTIYDDLLDEDLPLQTVHLGANIIDIGYNLYNCLFLNTITVSENNQYYSTIDGVLFDKDQEILICYPAARSGISYTVPDGVTTIGMEAFSTCANLVSLTISDSVEIIDENAIFGNYSLAELTIGSGVTVIGDMEGGYNLVHIINKSNIELNPFFFTHGISNEYYSKMTQAEIDEVYDDFFDTHGFEFESYYEIVTDKADFGNTLTIGDDGVVTYEVGDRLYLLTYVGGEMEVDLSSYAITDIGMYAFCNSLISTITLPSTLERFGYYGFMTYKADMMISQLQQITGIVTKVYYTGDIASWCGIVYADEDYPEVASPFEHAIYLLGILQYAPFPIDLTTEFYINNELVTTLTIPDTVTSINAGAFYGITEIDTIVIPTSVTSIGNYAFGGSNDVYIQYLGTVEQWNTIEKGYFWFGFIGEDATYITIHCSDDDTVFNKHVHNYQCVTVKEPTCTEYGREEYRCECGARQGHNDIPKLPHEYNNNGVCVNCGRERGIIFTTMYFSTQDYEGYGAVVSGYDGINATSIVIPDTYDNLPVIYIDYNFKSLSGITSVTIPTSVKNISYGAFTNCSTLESFTYLGTVEEWGYIYKGFVNSFDHVNFPVHCVGDDVIINEQHEHSYGNPAYTLPASCTSPGQNHYVCMLCGQTYDEIIPPLGHNYENGVCTYCGAEENAHEHNYVLDANSSTAPTCMNSGSNHYVCTGCDDDYYNNVPALGHNYENGVCTRCGLNENHTHDWVKDEDMPATCTSGEQITYKCKLCGETLSLIAGTANHNFVNNVCTKCGMERDENGILYKLSNDGTYYTVRGYVGESENMIIPATFKDIPVTKLGNNDDYVENVNVKTIYIPESIASVTLLMMTYIELQSITVSQDNPYFSSEGGVLFNKDKTTLVTYPINKPDTSYVIPSSVTTISSMAFASNLSLCELTIGENVEEIQMQAFAMATKLVHVINHSQCLTNFDTMFIGYAGSVEDYEAFVSTGQMKEIRDMALSNLGVGQKFIDLFEYVSDESEFKNVLDIDANGVITYTVDGTTYLMGYTGNDTNLDLSGYDFDVVYMHAFVNSNIESIILPDTVTSIMEGAFGYCDSLTTITLPADLQTIGSSAFDGCSSLTTINYTGSQEQWNAISKGAVWDTRTGDYTVVYAN